MNKELEPGSEYEKYDSDGDGVVTDDELKTTERLQALEIANEKAEAQKNMCWFALFVVVVRGGGGEVVVVVVFCFLLLFL